MFCLPVPHDKFETKTPWVIAAIAVIDAVLLIPMMGAGGANFIALYGFTPSHATLLTFFSGIFLHVGLWHYAGNMLFFWIFGRKIEATLGHLNFAALFLLSGIGGQLFYWCTALHSNVPCVGASGAISGVAGAYLILYPKDRFDLQLYLGWWRVKTIESNARVAVGVWIGEQALLGLLTLLFPRSSIAFWAHVGGFATGMGVAALYCIRVAEHDRPSFEAIEVPLQGEIAQPNPIIGLNLSASSKPLSGEVPDPRLQP